MSTDERVVMASRGLQVRAAAAGQMRRHLLDTHQRNASCRPAFVVVARRNVRRNIVKF